VEVALSFVLAHRLRRSRWAQRGRPRPLQPRQRQRQQDPARPLRTLRRRHRAV